MADLYPGRRRRNVIWTVLAYAATALGLSMLTIILATLLWNGFGGLSLDVFTKNTAPPGVVGGLLNSIVGSVIMTAIGLAIGAPLGILAGTYLAEYGANSRLAVVVRFINDILAQRAFDRRRPIYLRAVGRAGRAFLRACGRRRARGAWGADHGPHHRGHAQSRAQLPARSRLGARHATVARYPECRLPGRPLRLDHRRSSCGRAHDRGDRAADLHCARQFAVHPRSARADVEPAA